MCESVTFDYTLTMLLVNRALSDFVAFLFILATSWAAAIVIFVTAFLDLIGHMLKLPEWCIMSITYLY